MKKNNNKRLFILVILFLINIIGFAAASYYFSNFPISGSMMDVVQTSKTPSGAQISHIGKFIQFALEIIRETAK